MNQPEGVLWDLVRGTAALRGDEFFRELTRLVSRAVSTPYALVSGVDPQRGVARTLAAWTGADWVGPIEYALEGTPCGRVLERAATLACSSGVRAEFPGVPSLEDWGAEAYVGSPLRAASGELIGTLSVLDTRPIEDVHRVREILEAFAARAAVELERIRAEAELERQRGFLRQVLDVTPCFIFVKDRAGRFRLVNRATADVYGTTIDGLIGKTDADFNPNAEEVAFFRKMDLEVMDSQQERRISEESVTDVTGRVRWVQTVKRPIIGTDGIAELVLGVASDISELRRAREELLRHQIEERRKVQHELDRARDDLVRQTRLATIGQIAASIAHELRNPLGVINNAVFFLGRQLRQPEPKTVETLDIITREVRAADRIITDLLEMSRGKSPVKGPVDLGEVVRRTFRELETEPMFALDLRLEAEPFLVDADADQLRQVLANLLVNAFQAMPAGGRVTVDARRESGVDVITVSDEGVGVPAELWSRVFEPLFSTKTKGTGLGLTICRQIIEHHGGAIWIVPSAAGAAIRFRLPALATADAAPA
jgi:PAS domain S-box-containing protein